MMLRKGILWGAASLRCGFNMNSHDIQPYGRLALLQVVGA